MGRNNAEWAPVYSGEELFYGTTRGADTDKIEWATDNATLATYVIARQYGDDNVVVYTVAPVNPEETQGVYSGHIIANTRTLSKNFKSKYGFVVTGVHNG
jgi:hypothetical protein